MVNNRGDIMASKEIEKVVNWLIIPTICVVGYLWLRIHSLESKVASTEVQYDYIVKNLESINEQLRTYNKNIENFYYLNPELVKPDI